LSQNSHFNHPFDIVFIDPPYAKELWQPILTTLIEQSLITTKTLIYLEADKDLNEQLNELAQSLSSVFIAQGLSGFETIKQTKVGQVVAGLYRLESS
jgi:16S rRNA (guanine966-N2)-methyltransferase